MEIPTQKIPRDAAIDAAKNFISLYDAQWVQNDWAAHGIVNIPLHRGDFERISKVLLVGMGELSK